VPNLSNSLMYISDKYEKHFKDTHVHDLLNKPITEYHFVKPHESYVGPHWFLDDPERWININTRVTDKSDVKREKALEAIYDLPKSAKRLSMIVISSRKDDHNSIGDQLLHMGYNVIIEINSENKKDYNVKYLKDRTKIVKHWQIPYKLLEKMADDGIMKIHKNEFTKINNRLDLSLSHILCASSFMGTSYENNILNNISDQEIIKLKAIFRRIETNDKKSRPDDFPSDPHVAIVTGFMASRGITFQNAMINFVCSSFAFVDVNDNIQRGANNSQRFGRACGILLDVYKKNQPILIATKNILMNAVANEKLLYQKSEIYDNGDRIMLKDLITKYDWKKMKKQVSDDLDTYQSNSEESDIIDGVNIKKLLKYIHPDNNTLVGRMIKIIYEYKTVTFDEFKKIVKYNGSDEQFKNNIDNACGIKCQYGKLWNFERNIISINNKLEKYFK